MGELLNARRTQLEKVLPMAVSEVIAMQLPYLRRYARVLTGSQSLGDGLVRELLEALLADPALLEKTSRSRLELFAAFVKIYSSSGAQLTPLPSDDSPEAATVAERLRSVTPLARQALLLRAIEDFSPAEIGKVLGLSEAEVSSLIEGAIDEIQAEGRVKVLIIEDEPLISFQLGELVADMGNEVAGVARTHDEAVELFKAVQPSLVLADIQLADGSSGIDAVNEILADFRVPVIFITAFPERLLTGERPEPTFLVTKPFKDDFVRAIIGQAMFFGSTAPIA